MLEHQNIQCFFLCVWADADYALPKFFAVEKADECVGPRFPDVDDFFAYLNLPVFYPAAHFAGEVPIKDSRKFVKD